MTDDSEPVPPPYSPDDPLGESTSAQRKLVDGTLTPSANTDHRAFPFYGHAVGEAGALAVTVSTRHCIEHRVSQQQTSLPSPQRGSKMQPDSQNMHYLGGEEIADIPTKHPVPSGLLSASLVASLAVQAVARRVEQRTGDISCAGRRQYRGSPSHRPRCSRKKFGPAYTTDHAAEAEENGTIHSTVPLPSPASECSMSAHSAENSDSTNLSKLSKSMADMNLTKRHRGTGATTSSHADTRISSPDSKAMVASPPTFSNPPLLLNRPERRALKSDLKALKHEIRAAARQVRTERREEARNRGEKRYRAMSFQEKSELRAWKRESLGEVRKVARSVRRARRSRA
ncbi:hypothetical protein EPUS_02535 [Endocarpon pusillum Z07020]|uniref:Uncharacterized protein n=1 Tax=Endocarpon pusillum (strain Z07020 / HMAS-L-300199) TaxID=1263415 RepID=U1HNT5_ENDPU|nr:uncharacterized protein EPUS_02535 [Endocarpon pusillum Z07020]ERF70669.1 hypothetical protein EPUS_02535 [Endocarpon pusillum Z07020]